MTSLNKVHLCGCTVYSNLNWQSCKREARLGIYTRNPIVELLKDLIHKISRLFIKAFFFLNKDDLKPFPVARKMD